MDVGELGQLVTGLLERRYAGQFRALVPGSTWRLRTASALTVIGVLPDPPRIVMTAGACTDAPPRDGELAIRLGELNRDLWFGRLYTVDSAETGRGSVVLQEVVLGDLLSSEYQPSLEHLADALGYVTGKADELASTLCAEFGGRPLADGEIFVLFG